MQREIGIKPVQLVVAGQPQHLAVRHYQADVVIDGPMCRTDLQITFANDLGRTIEGDLVFPLPPFAALCELHVKVGARSLRGKFRPRQRAQAEYHRAVQAGQTAALGESEGEDLGRLRIAPIEAGEDVEVTLGVVSTLLPISDGQRLLLPLTYMPRFVENQAGLKPIENAAGQRPRPLTLAARADVTVSIRKNGTPIQVRCTTHSLQKSDGPALLEVRVQSVPLDRDLQLEIVDRPTGDSPTAWVRHDASSGPDKLGPSTAVALLPPAFAEEGVTVARTVILLVDRSGSMSGEPIAAAKRAVRGCLRALGPTDQFNIIAFSDALAALAPRPLPFGDKSLELADQFVQGLSASGGTEASMALTAVLDDKIHVKAGSQAQFMHSEAPPLDSKHRLRIVVMMTDGDVGSAEQVLHSAKDRLIDTRLFVIGIGESVNHAMLAQLASLGSGTYTPVTTNEDLERALLKLKNAIDAPILTGVRVRLESDGEFLNPTKLEPAGALDLYAGQPLLLAFREPLKSGAVLHISAQSSEGTDRKLRVPISIESASNSVDAETATLLWALLRNRRLTYRFDSADDATLEALGTSFGLVNRQVALLAIHDEERHTDAPDTVPVVLPLPRNLVQAFGIGSGQHMTRAGTLTGGVLPGGMPAAMPSASFAAPPPPAPPMPMMSPAPMPPMSARAVPSCAYAPAPAAAEESDADDNISAKIRGSISSAAAPSAGAKKSLLQKVVGLFSKSATPADADPAALNITPPPPPPAQVDDSAAPVLAQAAAPPSVPAPVRTAPAAAAAVGNFRDDEAGLRALLLEQRADGLFGGELAATVLALAALVSRGHSARAGSFRAELRRTGQTLQARIHTAQEDDKLLCALGLALLRMPHKEPAPAELPQAYAAVLQGHSFDDLPALSAAVQKCIAQAPTGWWQTSLAQRIQQGFFSS